MGENGMTDSVEIAKEVQAAVSVLKNKVDLLRPTVPGRSHLRVVAALCQGLN
jgi:hypothetical protein